MEITNKNWERFKTFVYKNSVPKENGETGACIDSDITLNMVQLIFENFEEINEIKNESDGTIFFTREQAHIIQKAIYEEDTIYYEPDELIDLIYNGFENKICAVCDFKRDTDINGNYMSSEIFCTKFARCESLDYGCNRFES